ncbi:prephenate dehydrogenase/arogenate dehydrogenase family protein, partial [Actinoplanes sp. NPDC024001]|uniref:prephenate dehydrogenase/arogenate dehydrogenase family protein n=1 Tax=Actinoplanes sp. NPDC024001 TaxID=3154598 RepID=UPI0033D3624F
PVDLALVAVPPAQVGPVLRDAQQRRSAYAYTDVAGVKGEPERHVLRLAPDPASYVGGHPMAGRERSGPLAATAELFTGKTWVLSPTERTGDAALASATALVDLCGAVPVRLDSRAHDAMVALTSHVPHLMASLTAARLGDGPAGTATMVGQGARDVTRIAAGDSALWTDIVRSNATAVASVLRDVRADLTRLLDAVEVLAGPGVDGHPQALRTVTDLLARGADGVVRSRPSDDRVALRVALARDPGGLGRLLRAAAPYGVTADQAAVTLAPDGGLVVRLMVPPAAADPVVSGLAAAGWAATPAEAGVADFS